jgi:hypothetical protein
MIRPSTAITSLVFLLTLSVLCVPQSIPASPTHSSAESKPSSPLAEQLIVLEKALVEAQKKHDRDFYKHTLTDDFISIGTDGKIHPEDEILNDLPSTELAEYRLYNVQMVQLNEGAAVVTYDAIVRMVHYDDETPRYQRVSSIWVRQGDAWKLRFQQATAAQ